MAETKISVRSDLLKIVEDLKVIAATSQDTGDALVAATKRVATGVNDQLAIVTGGMTKIRKLGNDVAKQLGNDFKNLFSVNALAGGLKLNEQFSGSIKQAVQLNDTMRSLAPIFGMNEAAAEKFKRNLVKGLGEIGAGSDAAANALQGLAETPVRGEKNLEAYAKTATEVAGISRQKGQEGAIAKGMSNVIVAEGGNPNDPKAMQKVAEDIVRIRNATGKSATEALDTLNKLFSSANTDFKKRLMQGGGVSLAAAGLIGGQGSTSFLERYTGLSKQQRAGYDAQGLGNLIGKNGQLNNDAFQNTVSEAKHRGGGNAEFGLQTMGMSDEEAKGFLRLADALKENGAAIDKAKNSVVDINAEYRKTMSLGDSFKANLNRVKGGFSELMDKIGAPDLINKGTNALGDASKSIGGSAAVVGGGALLAAVLTGGGLKGIGGALLGGEAKKAAIEGITGEKIQRVEVINWPGGFGGSDMAGAFGKLGKLGTGGIAGEAGMAAEGVAGVGALGTAGLAAGAVGVGYAGGKVAKYVANGGLEDDLKSIFQKVFGKNDKAYTGSIPLPATQDINVHVKSVEKNLKAYKAGSRGSSS